jgi:hypothetical protein
MVVRYHQSIMTQTAAATSPIFFDTLEHRVLLSVPLLQRTTRVPPAPITNINVSKLTQNQSEGAIAIDPTNPSRVFAFSNEAIRDGMMGAYSTDAGATWTRRALADGHDGLPAACCDPSAAFDEFGNLFISYINSATDAAVVALSADAGKSFHRIGLFTGDVDQPTITAGSGSVWVTFSQSGRIRAAGAAVTGLGQVGSFSTSKSVPSPNDSNFGDIAIGTAGQVMVAFQSPIGGQGPSKLYVSVDADGLGPAPFGKYLLAGDTNLGGFTSIPAQPDNTIDAEVGIAYDRSNSIGRGRAYLIYTTQSRVYRPDTSIQFRISNNDGKTWSAPQKLETDTVRSSQLLPRLSVDPTSGDVAVTWLDTRNDANPAKSRIDTDHRANTDAELWGIVLKPASTGVQASANFKISQGASNARSAGNTIDFGDYLGLTFYNGKIMPFWPDNSNSTRNNPGGVRRSFDMYTAVVRDPFAA